MQLSVIILAAGKGTRMLSSKPKVLLPIAGTAMLVKVITAVQKLQPLQIQIVCGHMAVEVRCHIEEACKAKNISFVVQDPQLGTGDAVRKAIPNILPASKKVLILSGDVPLITHNSLKEFILFAGKSALSVITATTQQPVGLGRIVREVKKFQAIVEEKDATNEQKEIKEINTGVYCTEKEFLLSAVSLIDNKNKQKEYYLTELVEIALRQKKEVLTWQGKSFIEFYGVNTRAELAKVERAYQKIKVNALMVAGGFGNRSCKARFARQGMRWQRQYY